MESRRSLTALQLELDRCVAGSVLAIRGSLESVERANGRIGALRAAAIAQALLPEAKAALSLALESLVTGQELQRARWAARRTAWSLGAGCSRGGWNASPYPEFPWTRPPPDLLGPRPLEWTGPVPRRFRIALRDRPRASAGLIEEGAGNGSMAARWSVRWTVPR